MIQKITLLTFLIATTLFLNAQSPFGLCEPTTDYGTTDGDYIGSIDYNGSNLFMGSSGSNFINYNSSLLNATIGTSTYIDVTNSAEISAEMIQVWVDLDGSGTLEEPGELMDSFGFSMVGQTTTLEIAVPFATMPKIVACRVLMHYITTEDSPCNFLTYGQIVDFPISLNSDPEFTCTPEFTLGPLDGDFLASFTGASVTYYGSSFSAAYDFVKDYENAYVGSALEFECISGDYSSDNYFLFVDEQYDGFDTGDLKDSHTTTTVDESFNLSYTIGSDMLPGVYRARIICRLSSTQEACPVGIGYGHCVDFYIIYNNVDASPYCNPVSLQGSTDGDYMAEFIIDNSSVDAYQYGPGPFYTYYADAYPFYALAERNNTGHLISGTYVGTDNYKIWIDYNQNNVFDTAEQMVAVESTDDGQTVEFSWTNPSYTNQGSTRLRAMCHFTDGMSDPCDASDFGEVKDFPVVLVKSNDTYCDPYFDYGNADGDFISAFSLNEVNLTGIGEAAVTFYKDYTSSIAQVIPGATYTIAAQSGEYSSDTYKVWVDWNNDGLFDNATEALTPEVVSPGAFQNLSFQFTVPAGATLGNKRLRMVCADDEDLQPCIQASYGEYLEITVAVVSEIGLPQLAADEIALYPNPGKDNLTIQYSGVSNVLNASIYNAMGQLIDAFQINQTHTLNHDYTPGYYTLKLSNGTSEVHKVFIVE